MAQSSVIFFFLLIGFLINITLKGRLGLYLSVLGIGGGGSAPTVSAGPVPVAGGALPAPLAAPGNSLTTQYNNPLIGFGY